MVPKSKAKEQTNEIFKNWDHKNGFSLILEVDHAFKKFVEVGVKHISYFFTKSSK